MHLLPRDIYENLEFDKVLELLEKECLGELGLETARALKPVNDVELIEVVAVQLEAQPRSLFVEVDETVHRLRIPLEDVVEELVADLDIVHREVLAHRGGQ